MPKRISYRERSRWIETLDTDRQDWMTCRPGCVECNGYGWHVADGERVERDDQCNRFPGDDEARAAAAFYLQHARSFIEALALGQLSYMDAKLIAQSFMGPQTLDVMQKRLEAIER